jgi:acetyl esterase/lipase
MNRTRALLLICAIPLLIVLVVLISALSGGSAARPRPVKPAGRFVPAGSERVDVGRGVRGAAIFRPGRAERAGPVVVFLHGWRAVNPSLYGLWIAHLVGEGTTVIYPAYQRRPFTDITRPLSNVFAGLRAAFADVDVAPGRLVVAGHSAGGVLAADYAVLAHSAGLPRPAAVFAVYPGRPATAEGVRLAIVDARRITAGTRVLALAGADDRLVGDRVARQIVRTATRAHATFRLVRDRAADDHAAPHRAGLSERRAFWAPLDALVAGTAGRH